MVWANKSLEFEWLGLYTIRKPEKVDHSKSSHVWLSDPHCTSLKIHLKVGSCQGRGVLSDISVKHHQLQIFGLVHLKIVSTLLV